TATDWPAFRAALDRFAVPSLNMLYADRAGHVGHALAAWIPKEPSTSDLVASRSTDWNEWRHASTLPGWFDPPRGFLGSPTARPPTAGVVIGRSSPPPPRAARLATLIEQATGIDVSALSRLQQDVKSETSLRLARRLAEAARSDARRPAESLLRVLEDWDGQYEQESRGAALFERVLHDGAHRF